VASTVFIAHKARSDNGIILVFTAEQQCSDKRLAVASLFGHHSALFSKSRNSLYKLQVKKDL
jgi:hypothetical protein